MEDNEKSIIDVANAHLEKVKDVAPGTCKHMLETASLCEAIGKELGLDVEVLKCAAMLHDIGKVNFPDYFSENQVENNPHDGLDSYISYMIITRHVADSVAYLIQIPEIPRQVIEIVSQHHGNCVQYSMYNKAKGSGDNEIVADRYRYKSRKPESVEAAILMIVDSVEATAKSEFNSGRLKTPESRTKVIDSTVDRLVLDGQLDELKIGVIRVVKEVLFRELNSTYHKRVTYHDDDPPQLSDKVDKQLAKIPEVALED